MKLSVKSGTWCDKTSTGSQDGMPKKPNLGLVGIKTCIPGFFTFLFFFSCHCESFALIFINRFETLKIARNSAGYYCIPKGNDLGFVAAYCRVFQHLADLIFYFMRWEHLENSKGFASRMRMFSRWWNLNWLYSKWHESRHQKKRINLHFVIINWREF